MGNFWKGVCDDRLLESEKNILCFSGLPYEQFQIEQVVIDEQKNYVRTIHVKKEDVRTNLSLVYNGQVT